MDEKRLKKLIICYGLHVEYTLLNYNMYSIYCNKHNTLVFFYNFKIWYNNYFTHNYEVPVLIFLKS